MVRLFCFPYAGASAQFYHRWRRVLPTWLDVCPVELPGRGARFGEPLQENLTALANQLAAELQASELPDQGQPFAFFGHSLGALLAFEVAHALRAQGAPQPQVLVVSASAAPTRRNPERYRALETDAELRAELQGLGGTVAEVLNNPEMLALVLPVLRADFRLCAGYRPQARAPLACALSVLSGRDDAIEAADLHAWSHETSGAFSSLELPGGHFFVQSQEAQVLAHLVRVLAPLRVPVEPASLSAAQPAFIDHAEGWR